MATYPVPLTPFVVPTDVWLALPTSGRREDGLKSPPTIKLGDLPRETVEALCDELKQSVLAQYDSAQALPAYRPKQPDRS